MTLLIIILLVTVVVAGASYGVYLLLNPSRTAGDRLRELAVEEEEVGFDVAGDDPGGALGGFTSRIGRVVSSTDEDRNKLRQLLLQAGYKQRNALEIMNGVKVTLALCLPLLILPLVSGMGTRAIFLIVAAAAAGFYLPGVYVQNVVDKRKYILLRAFPDSLDLLVSSVEAGLGIDAAFRRVSDEMASAAPELSKEYQLVNHEISAGVARVTALQHLYTRTGLAEVRSLVNMLAQAERFGTSIAKSLRVHAVATREKRMAQAEEEAAKVSPKLTVIMILFLLPVLMSILVGPAAINVKNTFAAGG